MIEHPFEVHRELTADALVPVGQPHRREIDSGPPFRLTHWSDGRLSLEDPSTGRRIELDAFGPTNTAVFARLMGAPAVAAN